MAPLPHTSATLNFPLKGTKKDFFHVYKSVLIQLNITKHDWCEHSLHLPTEWKPALEMHPFNLKLPHHGYS